MHLFKLKLTISAGAGLAFISMTTPSLRRDPVPVPVRASHGGRPGARGRPGPMSSLDPCLLFIAAAAAGPFNAGARPACPLTGPGNVQSPGQQSRSWCSGWPRPGPRRRGPLAGQGGHGCHESVGNFKCHGCDHDRAVSRRRGG